MAGQRFVWVIGFLCIALLAGGAVLYKRGADKAVDYPRAEQQWQALIQRSDSLHLHWLRTLNPFIRETQGDLVWNTQQQQGVMRFARLPRLKADQRYYLWVYDLHRPLEKPVAAGVFHVKNAPGKEYYIPFRPQQRVESPYKFLLTLGQKGDQQFSKSQSLLLAQP